MVAIVELRILGTYIAIRRAPTARHQMVLRRVDGDAVQPCVESAVTAKIPECAIGLDEGLLSNILSFLGVVDESHDQTQNLVLILQHQKIESLVCRLAAPVRPVADPVPGLAWTLLVGARGALRQPVDRLAKIDSGVAQKFSPPSKLPTRLFPSCTESRSRALATAARIIIRLICRCQERRKRSAAQLNKHVTSCATDVRNQGTKKVPGILCRT